MVLERVRAPENVVALRGSVISLAAFKKKLDNAVKTNVDHDTLQLMVTPPALAVTKVMIGDVIVSDEIIMDFLA